MNSEPSILPQHTGERTENTCLVFVFDYNALYEHNNFQGSNAPRMNDQLLPNSVPIATASKIAGLSPATFKARCIASGAVQVVGGRVSMGSLAAHLGHTISIEAFLRADRTRDRARQYQRDYRRNQPEAG
jgi:hypothetical protein